MKDNTEVFAGCLTVIVVAILSPVIFFGCGWLDGWILKFFIGDVVANALNLLFNTTRFTSESLPIVCGALATVGGFFKTSVSSNKN